MMFSDFVSDCLKVMEPPMACRVLRTTADVPH